MKCFVSAGVCIFAIAFLLVSYTSWPTDTPLSRYISPKDEYTKKTEMMLNQVADDVSKIRMLDAPDSIPFKVVTIDWVKENWGRMSTEAEIEEVRLEEEIYRALYLIPENFSLVELKIQEVGTIMAAVAGDTVYFVREYFDPCDEESAKELLAHEITHMLQGTAFQVEEPSEFDAIQAKNALMEGDAEFTKENYIMYKFNRSDEPSFTLPSGNNTLRDIDALWQLWVAPGIYGREFVRALYETGGWNEVNEAYHNLPASTEQIIHPEKYLIGEGYVSVELESVEGWDLKRSERFGEHFIWMVLARHIPVDDAKTAAEGWAGDRLAYYKMNGDYLFLWEIVWDSLTDRDEFLSAYGELLRSIGSEELAQEYYRTYYGYLMIEVTDLSVSIIGTSKADIQMILPS
jgi:hypothetical protein